MLSPLLRRYTWNSSWLYNVRIFIALCGTVALPWWLNDVKLTIPLTLGVVAGALADLDDRLAGRLRNLVITLVCFFIASASVELLFPWPWLFALGLLTCYLAYICYGLGLKRISLVRAAVTCHLEPVLGTLWVWLFWNESFSAAGWLGGALVLGAVLLLTTDKTGE